MKSKKKVSFLGDIKNNPVSYLLVLPSILYVCIFSYMSYPYMIIAFKEFSYRAGILGSEWVGFQNFEFFFKSNKFFTVTFNTLSLNIRFITFSTLMALAISLMLNEVRKKRFVKITQSLMLMPHYLSWVVVSFMLYAIFSMEFGLLNDVYGLLGLDPVNWYAEAKAWPSILTSMRVWKTAGFSAVIYLAAITSIDIALYESAIIDGANRLQQCIYITIPHLLPTVSILTIMSIGKIFYGDFGMIYALVGDNGILYPTTDIIDTYIFRALRQTGNASEAMAVGLFQSGMGFIMVFFTNLLVRKKFERGSLF